MCDDLLAETKRKNPIGKDENGKTTYGKNALTSMTSYMAETLEAMRFLDAGNETYIPSSGNFTTADVLPLKKSSPHPVTVTTDGDKASPIDQDIDEIDEVDLVMDSVKAGAGAAAGLVGKVEGSLFHDMTTSTKLNGKERSGTKEALQGLMEYYDVLYPDDGNPPTPLTATELANGKAENDAALDAFYSKKDYPRSDEMKNKMWEESKRRAETQYDRGGGHPVGPVIKIAETRDEAIARAQLYHYNMWVVAMVHNHPTQGLKSQAFANSDHHYRVKPDTGGEEFTIERKHTSGNEGDVVYASWEPDQGYTVNKKTGKVTPLNRYSSRFKHENPALEYMEEMSK